MVDPVTATKHCLNQLSLMALLLRDTSLVAKLRKNVIKGAATEPDLMFVYNDDNVNHCVCAVAGARGEAPPYPHRA